MKNSVTILLLSITVFQTRLHSQIFINTGNENLERLKKENPNIEFFDDKYSSRPTKKTESSPSSSTTPTPSPAPSSSANTPSENVTTRTSSSFSSNVRPADLDLPSFAEPGKCYARCLIPERYEIRQESVIDKPASYRTEVIPAVYGTVIDTIVVRKAYVKKTIIPAEYELVTEDVLVSPATTRWEKGKADATCLSANPADCQVWCLVEVPAVYKKVTKKILKRPSSIREEEIPAEYKLVERRVLLEPPRTQRIEIPATYKTVTRRVLVEKGGYQDWREVLCADRLNTQRILAIQRALKAEGYDPGPLDNVFGARTKEALIKFQQDKGLPIGNLNMETLKALGVE
ncbi:MAG: peptidoglycan-binding domain-containing protein [Chitinophagales bacterium]|nr:peptidoglycan-binding protein [Chitinophagales bacterium]MDW8274542.1 peptidoglycan-binding domain-containing protein [Chitinophagales bacterium]